MKLSELEKYLRTLREEKGDLEVMELDHKNPYGERKPLTLYGIKEFIRFNYSLKEDGEYYVKDKEFFEIGRMPKR